MGPKYCSKLVRLRYFSLQYQEIARVWLNLTNQPCWAFRNEYCNKIKKSTVHFDTSLRRKSVITTKSVTSTRHSDTNPSFRHKFTFDTNLSLRHKSVISSRHFCHLSFWSVISTQIHQFDTSIWPKYVILTKIRSDSTKNVEGTDFCRSEEFVSKWRNHVEVMDFCGLKGVVLVSKWRVEVTDVSKWGVLNLNP